MNNNKQSSSVDYLFQNMFEISQTLVTGGNTQYELMKKALDQAKAMHKEECIDLLNTHNDIFDTSEDHYNATFGGNNE
jgi:hypothetical protein